MYSTYATFKAALYYYIPYRASSLVCLYITTSATNYTVQWLVLESDAMFFTLHLHTYVLCMT